MDAKVEQLIARWAEENPVSGGWFSRFKTRVKVSFSKITRFLMDSLDELIVIVENLVDLGPDKKATVLNAIAKLYDAIVATSLPVWLRPFSPMIKKFVIDVAISSAIDFIVGKYRSGSWNKPSEEPTPVVPPAVS